MEVSPQFLYHHCVRTFVGWVDRTSAHDEIWPWMLYLVRWCDLGLTERFYGNQRFEVDGADAASVPAAKRITRRKASEAVWDAIALDRHKRLRLWVHLGSTLWKMSGLGLEDLDPETVERVIEVYPRVGCGQALLKLIISQVKRKPKSAAFTWMAEDGWCHIHGFACLHLSKSF